jgi:hypothetical protein
VAAGVSGADGAACGREGEGVGEGGEDGCGFGVEVGEGVGGVGDASGWRGDGTSTPYRLPMAREAAAMSARYPTRSESHGSTLSENSPENTLRAFTSASVLIVRFSSRTVRISTGKIVTASTQAISAAQNSAIFNLFIKPPMRGAQIALESKI